MPALFAVFEWFQIPSTCSEDRERSKRAPTGPKEGPDEGADLEKIL
jgi:hypothetical protein